MSVQSLDHYTINTVDLQRSVEFYESAVGLSSGERPNFDFPGAWLYCGDQPVVHLIGGKHDAYGTGSVNHVAFRAVELEAYRERLEACGVDYVERDVPDFPLHQVFLTDPDGVTIEMNFWEET